MKLPAVLEKRKISQILALDFETYWDADYTLSKGKGFHTTTEYVRSPKFRAHGVSVQFHNEVTPKWVTHKDLPKFFKSVKWSKTAVVCHETAFDGFILTQRYNVFPAYYFDTLSMARAYLRIRSNSLDSVAAHFKLGQKFKQYFEGTKGTVQLTKTAEAQLATYANQDVKLMWQIFLKLLPLYPDDELDLIHHTIRAYVEPMIVVDKRLAKKILKEDTENREALLKAVGYSEKDLRSRDKFADILRAHGVEPPMKLSPVTNQPTYAFAEKDLDFQELFDHPSEKIRMLCQAKLEASSTITKSKSQRLLAHADPALPIMLKYGSAHTLRWGGGDSLNPQNFPRNSDLRRCLKAPKGYKFVIVDSSQIEARMNFWWAEQWDALEDFRNKKDLYIDFASEYIYMVPLDKKVHIEERFVGKVCVLGLGYKMGWLKLGYTLESGAMGMKVVLPDKLLQKAVYGYRSRFAKVTQSWARMKQMLEVVGGRTKKPAVWKGVEFRKGQVILPNGMPLQYPRMVPKMAPRFSESSGDDSLVTESWTYDDGKRIYDGLFTENIIQALARLCVAQQILRVADRYRLVSMVHDEGVFLVPTTQAKQALKDILESFHTPMDWCAELPTAGEGIISDVYEKP